MSNEELAQASFSCPYWNKEFMSELINYGIQGMTNAGRCDPRFGISFLYDRIYKQEGELIAEIIQQYITKLAKVEGDN